MHLYLCTVVFGEGRGSPIVLDIKPDRTSGSARWLRGLLFKFVCLPA